MTDRSDRSSHARQPQRPRLSAQAARARATAQRYYERLTREPEQTLLSRAERAQQRSLVLGTLGIVMLFGLWCALRAIPVIEADVEARVERLADRRGANWVQVEVWGRHVRLYGVAPTREQHDDLLRAVRRLGAVADVANHLIIDPQALAAPGSDASTTPAAPQRLTMVFDGRQLQLSGTIGTEEVTTRVVREAERRYSAPAVITDLRIVEAASNRWRRTAIAAVEALALLEIGEARLVAADNQLTISGTAPDITTLSAVREVLRRGVPDDVSLRVSVLPLYRRDGSISEASCREALATILRQGPMQPSGDFTGLAPETRLTLDQVTALMQRCRAGLLVVIGGSSPAAPDAAELAGDVRRYLVEKGLSPSLIAVAEQGPGDGSRAGSPPITLRFVFEGNTEP